MIRAILILVLAAGAALPVDAQPRRKQLANRNFIERWSRLTPAEKDRALSKLPPERRREFQRKLDDYERLSPQERNALRQRFERFSAMTPEQQDRMRSLYRELRALPPERRQAVNRALRRLRDMPEADRGPLLRSETFRNRFSAEERRIINDAANLLEDPDPD